MTSPKNHRNAGSTGGSLENALEALLQKPTLDAGEPVVRRKSMDPELNPDQKDTILIRRNPFPERSEYEPANTEAGAESLTQWHSAGICDRYPDEHRLFAERDVLLECCHLSRPEALRARNACFRHNDRQTDYEEACRRNHVDDYELRRMRWKLDEAERERDLLNETTNLKRLTRIKDVVRNGLIKTPEGIRHAQVAQLLALVGSLPKKQEAWLPEALRKGLADAIQLKQPVDDETVALANTVSLGNEEWADVANAETTDTWDRIFTQIRRLVKRGEKMWEIEGVQMYEGETLQEAIERREKIQSSLEKICSILDKVSELEDIRYQAHLEERIAVARREQDILEENQWENGERTTPTRKQMEEEEIQNERDAEDEAQRWDDKIDPDLQ